MPENIDAQIAQKQTELEMLKSQGENVYIQFVNDVTIFLSNWYDKETISYVKRDSDRTVALGKEKLSEMKRKLKSLTDESGNIATKYLINTEICWHLLSYEEIDSRSHDTTADISRYRDNGHKELDDGLHTACEKIREILKPYGYIPRSYGRGDHTGELRYCPYRLDWSEQMKINMKLYGDLYEKAKFISQQIARLNQEKKEDQAKNLWDAI
jgi:hypothetical protein